MGRRRKTFARKLAVLVRLVPLVALFELSGFAHALADFVEVVVLSGHHESDCDDEKGGRPCDPGCAGCHCAHGGPTVPSPSAHANELQPRGELQCRAPDALRAPSPERAPPFRPPRYA